MDDYVKRSDVLALQRELRFDQIEQLKHYRCRHIDPISVKLLDAADVRENVHGDWVYQNPLFVDTIMCSVCGYNLPSDEFKTNFCPDCGADMRGEKT